MPTRIPLIFKQLLFSTVIGAFAVGSNISAQERATVVSVVPSGEVARADFVRVTFAQQVMRLGSDAADPFSINCQQGAVVGNGKWSDTNVWQYDFSEAIVEPNHCVVSANPDFKDLNGVGLDEQEYQFTTGKLTVSARPWPYSESISEDQRFILSFNGVVPDAQLQKYGYCAVEGIGERLPLKVIPDSEKKPYLETVWVRYPEWTKLVDCGRKLPTNAEVVVVLEADLSTDLGHRLGKTERFDYAVREPFEAMISCTRANQGEPCLPLSDIKVLFNAFVETNQLKQIQLSVNGELHEPSQIGDSDTTESNLAKEVHFKGPFPEKAEMQVLMPTAFNDDLSRNLNNLDELSQVFKLSEYPPLAKFAKQEFGIYELFKESAETLALIPVTQRHLSADQAFNTNYLRDLNTTNDAEVLRWMRRYDRLDETMIDRIRLQDIMADRKQARWGGENEIADIDTRSISIFAPEQQDLNVIELPAMSVTTEGDAEVIGVPLHKSGFHVLELASPTLGGTLLENKQQMYVRTTALVTNLAIHMKYSNDDFLAWVTRLDTGEPVADAKVTISDCEAKPLHSGTTDTKGRLYVNQGLTKTESCTYSNTGPYFVSAKVGAEHPAALGVEQYSFALSKWTDGIESWRFNIDNISYMGGDTGRLVEHSFFDRTLYNPGQIVAMKHYLRVLDKFNLTLPRASELPDKVRIRHTGSGDEFDLDVRWLPSASGGLAATTYWSLPATAKLGSYQLSYLRLGKEVLRSNQTFRVEEFKLPFLSASMDLVAGTQKSKVIVAPKALDLDLQLNYISGGAAANWDTELSAMISESAIDFADFPDYVFDSQLYKENAGLEYEYKDANIFLSQQALKVNDEGRGHYQIDLPAIEEVSRLRVENGFLDPNGELQTIQQSVVIWPADLAIGMQVESFDSGDVSAKIDLVLVNSEGSTVANHPVRIDTLQQNSYAVRKRLVGGFYSYDYEQRVEPLGTVCEGKTDSEGKFSCSIEQKFKGSVVFQAISDDTQGRTVVNADRAYFGGWGWLGSADHDRIDLVADKKKYQAGDTATIQVRMPFQKASALVAIERAGILETQVHELTAADPNVRLEIDSSWYPNVYVSVLAVRGRIEEDTAEPQPRITGLIDLNKPSYRFGMTELKVDDPNKQFNLDIKLDQNNYQLRETATAKIKGLLHDGSPAAKASVAIAVVDEALLELADNKSAQIIEAMRLERGYAVTTATAQSEIVGRRHYGRKAVAAGGAAADLAKRAGTRELFDTLLLWQPNVELDSNGEATVQIQLNDSISRFRVIAVGDYGVDQFAEGKADFTSSKDLQLISGIPTLVREHDNYDLSLTVRNTTDKDLDVVVGGRSTGALVKNLNQQQVHLKAKQSTTVSWPVNIDALSARHFEKNEHHKAALLEDKQIVRWNFFAIEKTAKSKQDQALSDSIDITQVVEPLVPITVRQSMLLPLAASESKSIELGLANGTVTQDGKAIGGISLQLRDSLLGQSDELNQWFARYPFTCYEQLAAVAVGLDNQAAWDKLMLNMPLYLDSHGLLKYFPGSRNQGSPYLTSYLLSLSLHAKRIGLTMEIPEAHKERMLRALQAVFEGRLTTELYNNEWRWGERLAALTTLAEYGQVAARTALSYYEQHNKWNMNDWVNWLIIAKSLQDPAMAQLADDAQANLSAMLSREGQMLVPLNNELTSAWWTMFNRNANLARLLFVVVDDPKWSNEMPYLLNGLINLQRNGHWGTTVANTYAKLAMQAYAKTHEHEINIGDLTAVLTASDEASAEPTKTVTNITSELFENNQSYYPAMMTWPSDSDSTLDLAFEGQGKLWVDVSAYTAVALTEPKYAGYKVEREVLPVLQQKAGQWTQGDVYRVTLKIHANAPMTWVVVTDPIPSGATILGSGLGRDSLILQEQSEQAAGETSYGTWGSWSAFVERGNESYRAYYSRFAQGETTLNYTVRLNHTGEFNLPPTRVETLYHPDIYGELPNLEPLKVEVK